MTQRSDRHGEPQRGGDGAIDPEMRNPYYLDWMAENVADMRRLVSGQRILYGSLAIGFVVGLVLQIVGYAVKASEPQEPLGLVADLLYALGWALWTGVVVAVFVEIVPRVKRRQIRQAIDAYEALANHPVRNGSEYRTETNVDHDGGRGPVLIGLR
jgi:hypothetical protein